VNRAEQAHARVVDEDGDRAQSGFGLRDQAGDFVRTGNVGLLGMNADVECEKFGGSRAERGTVSAADGNGGTELGQAQSDGLANTAVAAGNQGDFAGKRLAGMCNVLLNAVHAKAAFLRPRFLLQAHHNLKNDSAETGSGNAPRDGRVPRAPASMSTGQDRHRDFHIGNVSRVRRSEVYAKIPAYVRTCGYRNCLRLARAFTYNPKDFERDGTSARAIFYAVAGNLLDRNIYQSKV